jgi:hypothetical protein
MLSGHRPHRGRLGRLSMRMATDLVRSPPLGEQVNHHLPKVAIDVDTAPVVTSTRPNRVLVGIEWCIPVPI